MKLKEAIKYPKGFERFLDAARKSQNGREFIDKVRDIKDVPSATSTWFMGKYDKGRWDMFKASDDFVKDVKNGKYD